MNANATPADLPGKRRRPFDVGNLVLGRGTSVLVAGLLIFVLLSPLAFLKRKPYFHTGGSVLVSPKVRQVLSREERIIHGSFHDFAETQAQRMLASEVMVTALRSVPREEWPSFLRSSITDQEAAVVLRKRLNASPVNRSYLLFVSLTGDQPEGLAPLVNAVMQAYISKLETEQENQSRRRLDYLENEKRAILKEIEVKKTRQVELSAELRSRTFNELNNPYFENIVVLQEQFVLAQARELKSGSEVERASLEGDLLQRLDLNVLADDAVARNEAVYLIDNWTYQKLQELRGTIDGLTRENPDRVYVEERMKAMEDYLVSFKAQLHQDFHRILTDTRVLESDEAAARAEAAHAASRELTRQLEEAMEKATAAYERSTELIAEGKELDSAIENLRERFTLVDDSIRKVSLDAKAPTHVSIEERAMRPLLPTSDNLLKYLGFLFVGAFAIAGSVAVGLEVIDSRVRGQRDLRHALGQPAPDPVAILPEPEDCVEVDLAVYREPDHPASIAIRKLAVRLNLEREEHEGRVFLFAGAAEGAGETGVARNVAASLTQYFDRVLRLKISEGGHRLPTLPIRCTEKEADEAAVLEAGLQRIELTGRVASLEIESRDPLLENRARFSAYLEKAAELFDAVILETGPILESDLTQFLVHQVDVAVVVARHRDTPYAQLRSSVEFLYRSSLPAFTAVLSGSASSPLEQLLAMRDRLVTTVSQQGLRGAWQSFREERGADGELPEPATAG